jgi:hypothetical protein
MNDGWEVVIAADMTSVNAEDSIGSAHGRKATGRRSRRRERFR